MTTRSAGRSLSGRAAATASRGARGWQVASQAARLASRSRDARPASRSRAARRQVGRRTHGRQVASPGRTAWQVGRGRARRQVGRRPHGCKCGRRPHGWQVGRRRATAGKSVAGRTAGNRSPDALRAKRASSFSECSSQRPASAGRFHFGAAGTSPALSGRSVYQATDWTQRLSTLHARLAYEARRP